MMHVLILKKTRKLKQVGFDFNKIQEADEYGMHG